MAHQGPAGVGTADMVSTVARARERGNMRNFLQKGKVSFYGFWVRRALTSSGAQAFCMGIGYGFEGIGGSLAESSKPHVFSPGGPPEWWQHTTKTLQFSFLVKTITCNNSPREIYMLYNQMGE